MNRIRRIQLLHDAAAIERGEAPLSGASTAPAVGSDRGRQTESKPTNARSSTEPPPSGDKGRRQIPESSPKSTKAETPGNEKVVALLSEEVERLKRESERSSKEIDELRKQQEVLKADVEKVLTLLSGERELRKEERERGGTIMEEMELTIKKRDENTQMLFKEESERSKKEIDELRKQQEMMKADNEKVLTLLSEERELRNEEHERMETGVAPLRVDVDARAPAETTGFKTVGGEQVCGVQVGEAGADNGQGIGEPGEYEIISALQALQIQGVEDVDMRKILSEVLEKNEVKEWESLLAAGPNALHAIGKCFIVALSENVPRITQKRDKSIPADLRTNLVHCSGLGLETFAEAEDKISNLTATITAITEYRGIMDKIFSAVDDIRSAWLGGVGEGLQKSSRELTEHLGDLKQRAEGCAESSGSVLGEFKVWLSEVKKISMAYAETQREEIMNRNALEKIPEGIRSDLASLNTRQRDKKSVIEVPRSSLNDLKQIKESLELLDSFFGALNRQMEDLSGKRLGNFIRDVPKRNLTNRRLYDIRCDAYRMRCQYMHAESIASIYVEASQKYITPGVKLLKSLNSESGVSGSDLKKLIQLSGYHEDSLRGIHVFAERLPTLAQLLKRIEDGGLSSGE